MPVQISKAANETSTQNVNFMDSDSPWEYSVDQQRDATYSVGGHTDADLGQFFSRPLKIQSYQWTPGSQLFESFNPWQLYFENVQVLGKLNNFKNMRCDLCIKVQINGNAFYYGRALLSYIPYLVEDDVTVDRAFFSADLVGASQRPHMLIDPCSSQGGHMKLPFVWPENWLNITYVGWQDNIGRCVIHDFDVLQHANGGTDPISVNIFAWAENVELNVLTVADAQSDLDTYTSELDEYGFPKPYIAQAGKGNKKNTRKKYSNVDSNTDEFKHDGLISKPASAIAKAANALTMIPMLSPYAKATEMVATKVGQVAKIFGYSRPNNLSDITPYVPRFTGNLANCDAPETIQKLSVDSKNELSIDSRVVGLSGNDELTILGIASRPSYLTQFDWAESKVSGDKLFSISVDPSAFYQQISVAPADEIHPTALLFAANPFNYWQGGIKFRFQVVCSEYHRGRLRIVYDPRIDGDSDMNQTYSTIVDIAETRDFEYDCAWTNQAAWAQMRTLPAGMRYGTGVVSPDPNFDNGCIRIECMNELATPSSTTADVKILVWVSACDDFAVAVPRSGGGMNTFSYFEAQSSWEPYQAQSEDMMVDTDTSNNPVTAEEVPTFGTTPHIPDDNQYLVYQGERIVSFRELLRRYAYHFSYPVDNTGAASPNKGILEYQIQNFPFYRGWDPNGPQEAIDSGTGISGYNFCANTLINYLTPAFVCRRGSIRRKYIYVGDDAKTFAVRRMDNPATYQRTFNLLTPGTTTAAGQEQKLLSSALVSTAGTAVTPIRNNPVLEIELPYYTRGQRYTSARGLDYCTGVSHAAHRLVLNTSNSTETLAHRVDSYVSTGEDFNLSFFIGAPRMYVYNDPLPA